MKRNVLLLIAIGTFAGCAKKMNPAPSSAGAHRGVVIKNACCLIAIRTIDGSNIGQAWKDDGASGSVSYEHAFKVSNACQFGDHAAGDTISFNIIGPQVQNCMCCMMYTTTPDTAYSIQVIK